MEKAIRGNAARREVIALLKNVSEEGLNSSIVKSKDLTLNSQCALRILELIGALDYFLTAQSPAAQLGIFVRFRLGAPSRYTLSCKSLTRLMCPCRP